MIQWNLIGVFSVLKQWTQFSFMAILQNKTIKYKRINVNTETAHKHWLRRRSQQGIIISEI